MSRFQMKTRANEPQTTPSRLGLLASSPLGILGSRWPQLPGQFLGEVWVVTATASFSVSDLPREERSLCRGDRGQGRGHRRRRALMLAILYPHVLKAEVPMKRALAILGSAIFLVIAPGTLAG